MNFPTFRSLKRGLIMLALACAANGASVVLAKNSVSVVSTPNSGEVPDAEVDSKGVIHVAFVKGENAFYSKSTDAGRTFSNPVRINAEENTVHPPNMFRGPDLALGKGDRVHVILYGNGYQRKLPQDEWGVFYAHLDPGQSAFSRPLNLNHKPSDNYSLAADLKGNVSVIWMAGNLFVTESMDNGDTFEKAEVIENADPCECCASRALFANERLFIQYREKANNVRDMHLLTRAKGQSFRKQKLSSIRWEINACPMTGTFLAQNGVGLVSAWETKGQIFYARASDPNASTPETEISVSKTGKWPIALAAPDGSILVSWKIGSTLHWEQFDKDDKSVGPAESKPSPNTSRHAGVVTSDGRFVLID
jgi:hypothetical protein